MYAETKFLVHGRRLSYFFFVLEIHLFSYEVSYYNVNGYAYLLCGDDIDINVHCESSVTQNILR